MKRTSHLAFSLVELLVVIATIVVLLAMLLPAMDRAMYQAELAVCGTRLSAISRGVFTYAADQKRTYPYNLRAAKNSPEPIELNVPGVPQEDFRPVLRPYLAINGLNCALCRSIDIDGAAPDKLAFSGYALYFGWQYKTGDGSIFRDTDLRSPAVPEKGMFKMGNRFEWAGDRFNILAADDDVHQYTNFDSYGSHPDKDGMRSPWIRDGAESWATSRWANFGVARGPVDLQYALDDGSIKRYEDITRELHEDFREVPLFSDVTREQIASRCRRLPALP